MRAIYIYSICEDWDIRTGGQFMLKLLVELKTYQNYYSC